MSRFAIFAPAFIVYARAVTSFPASSFTGCGDARTTLCDDLCDPGLRRRQSTFVDLLGDIADFRCLEGTLVQVSLGLSLSLSLGIVLEV